MVVCVAEDSLRSVPCSRVCLVRSRSRHCLQRLACVMGRGRIQDSRKRKAAVRDRIAKQWQASAWQLNKAPIELRALLIAGSRPGRSCTLSGPWDGTPERQPIRGLLTLSFAVRPAFCSALQRRPPQNRFRPQVLPSPKHARCGAATSGLERTQ
jgi:hypothetical protein